MTRGKGLNITGGTTLDVAWLRQGTRGTRVPEMQQGLLSNPTPKRDQTTGQYNAFNLNQIPIRKENISNMSRRTTLRTTFIQSLYPLVI